MFKEITIKSMYRSKYKLKLLVAWILNQGTYKYFSEQSLLGSKYTDAQFYRHGFYLML